MKSMFLDRHPKLPANAPDGHPRILDMNCLTDELLRQFIDIPDLVVTILFEWKPEALGAFLDLIRAELHFLRRGSDHPDFCIQRNGLVVKVSRLTISNTKDKPVLRLHRSVFCAQLEAGVNSLPIEFRTPMMKIKSGLRSRGGAQAPKCGAIVGRCGIQELFEV